MAELFAGFADTFANKLLESQKYPLLLTFEAKAVAPLDNAVVQIELGDLAEPTPEAGQSGEAVLDICIDAFIEAVVERNRLDRGTAPPSEEEEELFQLFAEPLGDEVIEFPDNTEKRIIDLTEADLRLLESSRDRDGIQALDGLWKKIKKAAKKVLKKFTKKLEKFLKKHFRFTLQWTKIEVQKLPTAKAASSIEIRNLDVYAQVKLEACIKIRKWRCADITSPRVHLESPKFYFDLKLDGKKLTGKPRAGEMSLIVEINIFGYSFEITVGITGLINSVLGGQKPVKLFDFSTVELEIDLLKRKFVTEQVVLRDGAGFLETQVAGKFVPI